MNARALQPNLNPSAADDIYERLVSAHAGLSDAESMRFNARLILLLVNFIGDPQAVREAIDLAAKPHAPERTSPCT